MQSPTDVWMIPIPKNLMRTHSWQHSFARHEELQATLDFNNFQLSTFCRACISGRQLSREVWLAVRAEKCGPAERAERCGCAESAGAGLGAVAHP